MPRTETPADLEFRPRNERFDLAAVLATDWAGGDPVRTAFWNALSSLFPVGETFFVESVRPFAGVVTDERQRLAVRAFMGQEAVHSREHQRYNEALCAARGVSLEALEARSRRNLEYAREHVPPLGHLAITVAYEHFTAILAHLILTDPRWTAGMPPEMRRLWMWHAIEETEHKAVAFDVFMAAGGKREHLRKALLYVSREFTGHIYRNGLLLLRGSGISRPAAAWRLTRQIASMMWAVRREWTDFFRADFHPWRHDNRDVLARALEAYG
ncbi:MAG TPA: metal-dependent hydrolase [Azospirillaceae bacterium]|nr:metal-dependent hydrolase [Azospirillaceae bacterium]